MSSSRKRARSLSPALRHHVAPCQEAPSSATRGAPHSYDAAKRARTGTFSGIPSHNAVFLPPLRMPVPSRLTQIEDLESFLPLSESTAATANHPEDTQTMPSSIRRCSLPHDGQPRVDDVITSPTRRWEDVENSSKCRKNEPCVVGTSLSHMIRVGVPFSCTKYREPSASSSIDEDDDSECDLEEEFGIDDRDDEEETSDDGSDQRTLVDHEGAIVESDNGCRFILVMIERNSCAGNLINMTYGTEGQHALEVTLHPDLRAEYIIRGFDDVEGVPWDDDRVEASDERATQDAKRLQFSSALDKSVPGRVMIEIDLVDDEPLKVVVRGDPIPQFAFTGSDYEEVIPPVD